MTREFLDDAKAEERSALRYLCLDSKMDMVGETAHLFNTFTKAPVGCTERILVDQVPHLNPYLAVLEKFQKARPATLVIVLPICSEARQQAALTSFGKKFIRSGETLVRAAESL